MEKYDEFNDETLAKMLDEYHDAVSQREKAKAKVANQTNEDDEINDENLAGMPEEYHAAEDRRRKVEAEIMTELTKHFDSLLRPALRRAHKETGDNASMRYTVMVNDFFVRVLEKRDDSFWKTESLYALRGFASMVICGRIIEVKRRSSHKKWALKQLGLDELATDRAEHLKAQQGLDFYRVLPIIQRWDGMSGKRKRWAQVLRSRYLDGMTYELIAEQMGVKSTRTIENLKSIALKELRNELS